VPFFGYRIHLICNHDDDTFFDFKMMLIYLLIIFVKFDKAVFYLSLL
jgi:hypothetical protein